MAFQKHNSGETRALSADPSGEIYSSRMSCPKVHRMWNSERTRLDVLRWGLSYHCVLNHSPQLDLKVF